MSLPVAPCQPTEQVRNKGKSIWRLTDKSRQRKKGSQTDMEQFVVQLEKENKDLRQEAERLENQI
jgi:hypothetical protein